MNTVSNSRAKHDPTRRDVPPKTPLTFSRWSPLLFALILTLFWFGFSLFSMSLMRYQSVPMFYPLLLAMNSYHEWIEVILLILSMLFCHALALRKGLHQGWVALSLCVQSGLLVVIFMMSIHPLRPLIHLSSLSKESHTYQLMRTQDGVWGFQAYTVLECDPTGLVCHYYATPYSSYSKCFAQNATIGLDPSTQRLILYVPTATYNLTSQQLELEGGTETYPIEPGNDGRFLDCPVKGLTR